MVTKNAPKVILEMARISSRNSIYSKCCSSLWDHRNIYSQSCISVRATNPWSERHWESSYLHLLLLLSGKLRKLWYNKHGSCGTTRTGVGIESFHYIKLPRCSQYPCSISFLFWAKIKVRRSYSDRGPEWSEFEPMLSWLQVECSTTELSQNALPLTYPRMLYPLS